MNSPHPHTVTVLMPVHNAASYLREAIQSILDQTFRDFEFLIVDDCSTDGSYDILQGYRDPRIRVIHSDRHLKLAGALNLGMDLATGKYLARMDADDISLPERLAVQVDFMEQHPDIGICGSWVKTFGTQKGAIYRQPVGTDMARAYTLFESPFMHPTVVMRRSLFEKATLRYDIGYYPTEDYELWERALRLFPGTNLPTILLRYRVHGQSMTQSDWPEMDRQASLVAARGLRDLGIEPTETEARFHRALGRGRSLACQDLTELARAETWLLKLRKANHTAGVYPAGIFEQLLQDVWFRICFNSASLGWRSSNRYAASALAGPARLPRRMMVTAAVLKAAIRRPSL